jgi:hypothetical protein
MKPINYVNDNGLLVPIDPNWVETDELYVDEAKFKTKVKKSGLRRIYPLHDSGAYIEFGVPSYMPATDWEEIEFNKYPVKHDNVATWITEDGNLFMRCIHAGHYNKIEFEPALGYTLPGGRLAFAIDLKLLTREGDVLSLDGVPVMTIQMPIAYDADNKEATITAIPHYYVNVKKVPYLVIDFNALNTTTWARPVIDPTLTLQPAAADGIDTYIYQYGAAANNNYGIATVLGVYGQAGDNARALVKFGLSALPSGIIVSSSVLTVTQQSGTGSVGVRRALTEWYEGNKNNATPGAGVDGSTWNYRNHNGSVVWAGGAGGGSGSDYAASATDTKTFAAGGVAYTITPDVSYWVSNPTLNYGVWFIATGGYNEFRASDYATASSRPKLEIIYSLPCRRALLGVGR